MADEGSHSWEFVGGQAWESVSEDADGNIIGTGIKSALSADVAGAIRRRRRLRARYDAGGGRRVVRDMLRYVYVLLDMSRAMAEKDPALPPGSRLSCAVAQCVEFVRKFFDENPISHLGIVIMKDGEAEILTQLSGNAKAHIRALTRIAAEAAAATAVGEFSLQNGLEVAGRSLGHMPQYGSREIVILCGALSTCDPGDLIVETLPRLKQAGVRVSCIALAAEIYVCRRIAEETEGTMNVCIDKNHFREVLMAHCIPPPAVIEKQRNNNTSSEQICDFVQMGFPTRETSAVPSLIHITRDRKLFACTGYVCPRCKAKAFELPTDCAVCGLKLVLSPHLARSFHHLFPVPPFRELKPDNEDDDGIDAPPSSSNAIKQVPSSAFSPKDGGPTNKRKRAPPVVDATLLITSKDCNYCCYACLKYIGPPRAGDDLAEREKQKQILAAKRKKQRPSSTTKMVTDELGINLRFQCPECDSVYCAECDAYLHETLHNCPGCLRKG